MQHLSTVGITKIAVFYQNDSYGKAGLDGMMRALEKRKIKPVGTMTVERNSVDVAASLAELLKLAPEAVVQISAYKSSAALIKQARAKSYSGQFFNVSFVGARALNDELGDIGVGVTIAQVVPFPFASSSAVGREYQQRMTEAGDKDFDFSSMEGFLAAKVLTEGLRRAGKALSRDALVTALESLRDYNMGGFTVTYGPGDHEGSKFTELTIMARGGKFMH